jgi:hypothetical protein
MTSRIRFIEHEGKQIVLVDVSNCSAAEVEETIREVPEVVTVLPRRSVLILADFTRASFDEDAMRAMKETAVFDKPFIKKSAWVGTQYFPAALSESMKELLSPRFSFFRDPRGSLVMASEGLTWGAASLPKGGASGLASVSADDSE